MVIVIALLTSACGQQTDKPASNGTTPQDTSISLALWAHAGQEAERSVLQAQVKQFNQQTAGISLKLTFIPERDYNAQVQAAALAGDLPDILEFDGPYLYNYIWQNHLLTLDELIPAKLKDDLIPSIVNQGTYRQHLYSVGVFDSGLGIYARKSALTQIKARIPSSASDAWSSAEFNTILARLAKHDNDGAVLDLKLNYGGEWFTYGFSPVLQSAGADLVNRKTYQASSGVLNSPAAISAMQVVQHWMAQGWVDPNLDDAAFVSGRVMLSWAGHWEYPRYRKAWQDDLIIVPLPDFGTGSKTGQGSWSWAITRNSQYPRQAVRFLAFLLQTRQVLAMCDANGAVPGTRSALKRSMRYGKNGPLRLFADQLLARNSVPRPKTPGYPFITTTFQETFQQIRNGANVKQVLDTAAAKIDQDIRDNKGYPSVASP